MANVAPAQSPIEGSQGSNVEAGSHTEAMEVAAYWLALRRPCILCASRPTWLGVAPPAVGWALHINHQPKNLSLRHSQSNLTDMVTLAGVKLSRNNQRRLNNH